MSFLSWHYSNGISFYFRRYIFTIKWIAHYFSLSLLLTSLFAPWKRLVDKEKKPGFDLTRVFEKFTFNILSRIIGAAVRLTLLLVGIFAIVFVSVTGLLGLVVWILIPLLSYSIYQKFCTHPKIVAEKLV